MEEQKEWLRTAGDKAKGIFTKKNLKRVAAACVVCALLGGGGAWGWHQHKAAEHQQILQARTALVENQAAQKNMMLIDQDQAKMTAAATIGVDPGQIEFRQIALVDEAASRDKDGKHKEDKHKDRKKDGKEDNKAQRNDGPAIPATAQPEGTPPVAGTSDGAQTDGQTGATAKAAALPGTASSFRPVYEMDCRTGGVTYKIHVDAVSGEVLQSKVG